jgi:hypothetical protein
LIVDSSTWLISFTGPGSSTADDPVLNKKKRTRGKNSSAKFLETMRAQPRNEKGFTEKRQLRLTQRSLSTPDMFANMSYDILVDGNFSEPGWQGARPPQRARDLIDRRYLSGVIKDDIRHFFPIHYPTAP